MKSTLTLAVLAGLCVGVWGAEPEGAGHWAFSPPIRSSEPAVRQRDRVRTPVDAFLLARLEREGLGLGPEADRATLLRRLSFDLLGLPPSPEQLATFLADASTDAYDKAVEVMLASPHYGERWGRHWLDLVAYADSNGYFNADSDRPLAWRYRDYVVRSLNADKPVDRFVREQVAGDLLAGYEKDGDVTTGMVELLTATHLLRNAPDGTAESDGNAAELRADRYAVLEGTVQILGSAFLGLTVQCARCHHHKFEPISQDDYYGLQAIFKPIYDHDHWVKPTERNLKIGTREEREDNRRRRDLAERELKAAKDAIEGLMAPYRQLAQQEAMEKISEPLRGALKKAIETKDKDRSPAMKELLKTNDAIVNINLESLSRRFAEFSPALSALEGAVRRIEAARPAPLPELAVAVPVTPTPAAHQVLRRGNYADPIRPAPPRAPAVLAGNSTGFSSAGAGAGDGTVPARTPDARLAFADWLVSARNPMFARLIVNRVWEAHFGLGLVPTVDNFGLTGARPTHPELLDWLATEFMASGYKLKALHRVLVRSTAYRQSSQSRDDGLGRDPDNRWLWRYPLRRLDAESIRDAMLAVGGEIDLQIGGPFVPKDVTEDGQVVISEKKQGWNRRSLYLQQHRSRPVSFVDVFDGVKFNPNCIQRGNSTMALQSLTMLNSDFARARARAFARRLLHEAVSPEDRLARAFQLALGRPPWPSEREAALEFLGTGVAPTAPPSGPGNRAPAPSIEETWTGLGQMLLAGNAFLYVE